MDISLLEYSDKYQVLGDRQQELARIIAAGTTSVEKLLKSLSDQTAAHVTQEHVLTRRHVNALNDKFTRVVETQAQQVELNKFMQSLHIPEIDLRQEKVGHAHEKTSRWILEERRSIDSKQNSFSNWLRDDEQLYWILGKPGSGRSTLMKFIV